MLGGNKQSFIWTTNGSRWFIVDTLIGSRILAEAYGSIAATSWDIPESRFNAEFIEAKDLRYIADVVEHAPIAGFSSRLLRSAYAGFATQVRRSSDNMNADIGFIDAFDYDVAAFNAHVGGGSGLLRTWYDQFGVNDSLQTVNVQQPLIGPTGGSNSRPSFFYEGNNCRMPVNSLAASFSGTQQPFTFLSLVRSNSLASTRTVISGGSSTSNTPFISQHFNNAPTHRLSRRDDPGTQVIVTGSVPVVNTHYILGYMFDGVFIWEIFNGVITKFSPAAILAITLNRFTIGGLIRMAASSLFSGQINEVLVWDQPIGTANLQQASYNMNQFYAVY